MHWRTRSLVKGSQKTAATQRGSCATLRAPATIRLRYCLLFSRWPGGLADVSPLTVPALLIVAEEDEYMARSESLLVSLRPSSIMRVPARGHHDVLYDEAVKRGLVRFLTSSD